jgi:opacity protein-like surface antigen
MFKSIITLAAIVASSAAFATDLPSKMAPSAPAPVASSANLPYFVGVRGGDLYKNEVNNWTVGGNAGYEVNKFARVEFGYDRLNNKDYKMFNSDVVTGNVIAQIPLNLYNITPYVLAGVGYGWSDYKNGPMYNFGGGIRYNFAKNIELDGRYRHLAGMKKDKYTSTDAFTLGVNYKF